MSEPENRINAVFEGGGVKGIGLVGAIAETEQQGYRFERVAGTSAGAIVAALLAAGYSAREMKALLSNLDYEKFRDTGLLDQLPVVGPALSILLEMGLYEGDFFESWLREHLAAKNIYTFGDLISTGDKNEEMHNRYRLQVIATDISRGRLLVLPRDAVAFGLHPDELEVARAVRMSASLPFFFEPVVLQNPATGESSYIVDGGLLSNFPVWLFDQHSADELIPTIGYKLVEPGDGAPHPIRGPLSLISAMITTMLEAHDARYIQTRDFARIVAIPTLGVRTTDFSLGRKQSDSLYRSGRRAAGKFFGGWDFNDWKRKYRVPDLKHSGVHDLPPAAIP